MKSKRKAKDGKESKKKEDSNELKNLLVFLLVITIVFLAIGAILKQQIAPKIQTEYSNGFEFKKVGGSWFTKMLSPLYGVEVNANFRYAPSEVRDIVVEGDVKKFVEREINKSFFTFNPQDNLTYMAVVAADLAKYLKVLNGIDLEASCTKNVTSACEDRPIISCETEKTEPVIYVKSDAVSKVSYVGNCLIVQGSGEGLLKAYNKLLFLWYGIL
ncbi:hypothetical protein JXB27_02130 [Candidatus Woesearchaeota archaeon]|nr:hypothetical protein [Candidatus Woesearchaeota archaeon]